MAQPTVHAQLTGQRIIVHHDRKWWVWSELPGGPEPVEVTATEAARLTVAEGWQWNEGMAGGSQFDRLVRKLRSDG